MTQKKEPLVINCTHCNTRFRMWLPPDIASSWERGAYISCVNCGTRFQTRKEGKSYIVSVAVNAAAQAAGAPARAAATTAPPPAAAPSETPATTPKDTGLLIEDDRL